VGNRRTLTGQGFDVHRFCEGRPLVLGGVKVPYEKGLAGHSDADVLTHAVCDAVLGAIGAGDIGEHFPDTDPAYKDASSLKLLESVVALAHERGAAAAHVDVTLVAQQPRIGPYKQEMKQNLERVLKGATVNIKATTTEGLGLTGRGEGIAAMAVATMESAERKAEK
jgi:2-C-methyl-D-erythritol 2,4-cyclodiphosphate synthase